MGKTCSVSRKELVGHRNTSLCEPSFLYGETHQYYGTPSPFASLGERSVSGKNDMNFVLCGCKLVNTTVTLVSQNPKYISALLKIMS